MRKTLALLIALQSWSLAQIVIPPYGGGGGGGGGAGEPPYSTTSIGASPFSIPESTHNQGLYAFAVCWDSAMDPQTVVACNVERDPATGDLTITYTSAPGAIQVYGATGGFSNPMTSAGDIIIGGASGVATRLAAGTNGYVLTLNAGSPVWAAAASGTPAFSAITSATNTTAAMVVGTGASLGASGSGTITATAVPVGGISGLGTGVGTWLATPSGANLASALTTSLPNTKGGTGGDSSAATGIAHVASGTWSYSTIVNADINASAAIALSKLATQSDQTILANISGGAAVPSASTLTAILDDILGTTQGSVLYRNATVWTTLSPGTNGQFLQTQGAAANPQWASVGGSISGLTTGTYTRAASATTIEDGLIEDDGTDVTINGGLNIVGAMGVAGAIELTEGTACTPSANSVCIYAPADITTAYGVVMPAASATGFLLGTDSSNVNTLSFVGFSGTGNVARVSSPTFTTPTLGAATATSINGLTITSSTGTLTITNGKTASVSNTLTFTGTDSSSIAFGGGGTAVKIVASGTSALGTSSITQNTCATVVTTSATGVATTDVIQFTPNADISAVTGYTPGGTLKIIPYPSANNVNFLVCNTDQTNPVTPGAVTLNWQVTRSM